MFGRTVRSVGRVAGLLAQAAGGRYVRAAHCCCRGARLWGLSVPKGSSGAGGRLLRVLPSARQGRSRDCFFGSSYLLAVSAAAFSIFSKIAEEDEGLSESEQKIVYLLKLAKLRIMKDELDEAEDILHKALHLSHECKSKRAIIYTYDLLANLEFLRGHYENAEKLFKFAMIHMLDSGVKQDDNAFLEISLKLASIYAAQKQEKLAVAGYQFCIMSLDEKAAKEKDLPPEVLTAEEKSNSRLLLGLCLDSYARYLVSLSQLSHAQTMYERALQICKEEQGDLHPQTVTLLNDLATVLEAQGRYDEALLYANQALHLAEKSDHPDHHIMLANTATILMYQGRDNFADAERIFMKALAQAKERKDTESAQHIQEELSKLLRKQKDPNI